MRRINKLAAAVISAIMLSSCGGEQPEMPIEKFAQVIYDVHRADAILEVSLKNDRDFKNDSLSYYNEIFVKHGISKEQFHNYIQWYVDHPAKYKELYARVMKIVSKEEEARTLQAEQNREKDDLWNQKSEWHLPSDGHKEAIAFDIEATEAGSYALSADLTYYSDDKTDNPRMTLIANYSDGSNEQNNTFGIMKDGKSHSLTVKLKTNEKKKLVKLTGWVLDHSDGTISKHVDVYNIKLKLEKE